MLLRTCAAAAVGVFAAAQQPAPLPLYGAVFVDASAPNGLSIVTSAAPVPATKALIVSGTYTESINTTGWATLELHSTSYAANESIQAYAAGYLEAALTWERCYQYARNAFIDVGQLWPEDLAKFVDDNTAYVRAQAAALGATDPFWFHAGLTMDQLQGLFDGYAASAPSDKQLTRHELYAPTLVGDLFDLDVVFPDAVSTDAAALLRRRMLPRLQRRAGLRSTHPGEPSHCSAMVALQSDGAAAADGSCAAAAAPQDLFVAHATWAGMETMMRIYKLYDFPWRLTSSAPAGSLVPGQTLAFSSYPATLYSSDDLYAASSGLVVMETTLDNENEALWKYVVPQSVFTWSRAMLAMRLGTSGANWAATFLRQASGTYNNAWHVVDMTRFKAGAPLADGLLWLVEQMPGPYVAAADITDQLRSRCYWASYNLVYNATLATASGQTALEKQYGPLFSWANTSRAQIFARELDGQPINETSVRRVIRLNRFQDDPVAEMGCKDGAHSGANAIAARADLTSPDVDCEDGGQGDYAAVDGKYTSASLLAGGSLVAWAQSGPSYDDQPVFAFSNTTVGDIPHAGMPNAWAFPWVRMAWP